MSGFAWLRLPFRFDAERLRADLDRVRPEEWVAHYNQADYAGDWSGVALRSPGGSAGEIFSSPECSEFHDTPALARCEYFRQALAAFECPLKAVRLLRLKAGSRVLEHRDSDLRYQDGELRIHVPVATNPDVEFVVAGQRLPLKEGEAWYIDFTQPHRIDNRGATDRVHLVIDGLVNDWVRAVFAASERPRGEPAGSGAFEHFREVVFEDDELQARLLAARDKAAFTELTVALGRERGFDFTGDDVEMAFRAGKRAWIERWVEA